jgi:hypothetical protein
VLLIYNQAAYGSPFLTGYGTWLLDAFAVEHFPVRFLHYVGWLVRMLSPMVVLGWMVMPFLRRVPLSSRALVFSWFAAFFLLYCFYEPHNTWWFTRFLLPGLPAMILGALVAWRELIRDTIASPRRRQRIALLVVWTTIAMAVHQASTLSVLGIDEEQAAHRESCRWAETKLPPGALVASAEMSGALMYYTSLTPVRWDALEPSLQSQLRARTEAAGAEWFALLLPHEVPMAQQRLPGSWTYLGEHLGVSLWQLVRSGA